MLWAWIKVTMDREIVIKRKRMTQLNKTSKFHPLLMLKAHIQTKNPYQVIVYKARLWSTMSSQVTIEKLKGRLIKKVTI